MSDPYSGSMSDQPQSTPPGVTFSPAASASPGCASSGARVLAAIAATLFVLATPAVMLAFNAERIVFSPAVYKQALSRMDFYNRLPSLLGGEMADSIAKNPEGNQALASLSKSDLQAIIAGLIPQGWAEQQTEGAIDQVFTWLNTEQPDLKVVISMAGVKQQLVGPAGSSALLKVMSSWPDCTDEQITEAALKIGLGDLTDLPQCNPPESLKAEVTAYFGEVTAQSAASIPDTVDLAAPNGQRAPITPANDPRPQLRLYRSLALFSPILPALLLLVIAGLAVRSWRGLGLWWGIPLIAAAILGGLAAVGMLPLRETVTQVIAGQGPPLPFSLEDVVSGVAGYVLQTIGWWIGGESAVMGGAGVILLIVGFAAGRKPQPAPPGY